MSAPARLTNLAPRSARGAPNVARISWPRRRSPQDAARSLWRPPPRPHISVHSKIPSLSAGPRLSSAPARATEDQPGTLPTTALPGYQPGVLRPSSAPLGHRRLRMTALLLFLLVGLR